MLRILGFLAFVGFLLPVAWSQQSYPFFASSPSPPLIVTATANSPFGQSSYCYWVVANYPIGKSTPSVPSCVPNAIETSSVLISWSATQGASSYDVLRTTTPILPNVTSSIAVATGVSSTTQTDSFGALSSYTITSAVPATANLYLDNTAYSTPQLRAVITGVGGTTAFNLGSGGGGTPGGSSGQPQWNSSGSFAGTSGAVATGTGLFDHGSQVYNVLAYGVVAGDVDSSGANSTAMLALMATVNTNGGGTIYFPSGTYRFNSQLFFPNTGGGNPLQSNIRWTGEGGGSQWENGTGHSNMLTSASILDLQYQGNNNAKIETEGQATAVFDHLTFTDNSTPPSFSVTGGTLTNIVVSSNSGVATFASTLNQGNYIGATWKVSGSTTSALNANYDITAQTSTTLTFTTVGVANGTYNNGALTMSYAAPFLHATATTLRVSEVAFIGASGQTTQDAIVLGGNTATATGAQNDPFNGYYTTISDNSFALLNRGLYLRTYAVDVTFERNSFVRRNVGTVAVECNGSASSALGNINVGNRINNNLVEMDSYIYFSKFTACRSGTMIGNSFYDVGGQAIAYYQLNSTSYNNYIVLDETQTFTPAIVLDDDSGVTRGTTTLLGGPTRVGMNGFGQLTAEIPYGMNVTGHYDSTKLTTGYPGQFTITDYSNANARLSCGVLASNDTYACDAARIGTGAQTFQLNPGGGAVQMPQVAGATSTVNGGFKYDTTSNNLHMGVAAADSVIPSVLVASPLVNNDVVKASVVSGKVTLIDGGQFGGSTHAFGSSFSNSGNVLVSTSGIPFTLPYACTIRAWNIALTPSGTATFEIWKVATGTAIPTVANTINTSGVSISSGTAVHSTTLTDFTSTAVSANDIAIVNLKTVGGSPTGANFTVQCD